VRDGVIPRADQQEPHERTRQPSEQTALLPHGAREIAGDDGLHRPERAHAGFTEGEVVAGCTLVARVRAKYTSSNVARRMTKRLIPGAAPAIAPSSPCGPLIPRRYPRSVRIVSRTDAAPSRA